MQWMRARVVSTNGNVTEHDVKVEQVRQVVKYVDGYPSPPQWEVVRMLTEDEVKELGISFVEEKG